MTGEEIKTLITKKSIDYALADGGHCWAYYPNSETALAKCTDRNGWVTAAKGNLSYISDAVCVTWNRKDWRSGCFRFSQRGDTIVWADVKDRKYHAVGKVEAIPTLPSRVLSRPGNVPLPPDLSVEAPGPGVIPELARFAGTWGNGAWGGIRHHVLIVEQVRPDGQARVVYAVGDAPGENDGSGYTRVTAHIEDDVLTFKLRGGDARVDYRIEEKSLRGEFTIGDRVDSRVTLERTAVR